MLVEKSEQRQARTPRPKQLSFELAEVLHMLEALENSSTLAAAPHKA